MNGYTSGKTTHDPEPWVVGSPVDGRPLRSSYEPEPTVPVDYCEYAPRPEFDNHNPILVRFRKWVEGEDQSDPTWSEYWLQALTAYDFFGGFIGWNNPKHVYHVITTATDEQRDHARRVLTKLAALTGVVS